MAVPTQAQCANPNSNANGLNAEQVTQRAVSLLAMLATGTAPDGTSVIQSVGSGTADVYTGTGAITAPQLVNISQGSDASPVTTGGPTVRISRVEQLLVTSIGGVGATNLTNEASAALVVQAAGHSPAGPAGTYMQTNAIFAYAFNDGPGTWDAVTIQSIGRTLGTSTRRATAGYFEGRKDNDGGLIGSVEIRTNNQNPGADANDAAYVNNGASNVFGLLMSALSGTNATHTLAAGMQFTSADSGTTKWGVGIGFTTNAVLTNDIRSDSAATTAILLNGSYSSAAIAIPQASNVITGPVVIGGTAVQNPNAFFEIQTPSGAALDPAVVIGRTDTTQKIGFYLRNSSGSYNWGVCGGAGDFFAGTAAGDAVLVVRTGTKSYHIGGGTKVVTVTNANTLGFFATTPVAKQSGVGTATGYAAGATVATFHSDDTYTGNTGATAYTINGIVAALKNYGLLAA